MSRVGLWLGIAGLVLAGCSAPTPPIPSPSPLASPSAVPLAVSQLNVSNQTTITVTVLVNGHVIATVRPGVQLAPIPAVLPPRPWSIETHSPTGRVLSSLQISATDYVDNQDGRGVRADLSCGRLDLWSGPPMMGPVPIPGPSGDCA